MKIVTSGSSYIDIDAYAGCVAYAELLRQQGYEAQAVCEAPWNESVSSSVRSWQAPFHTTYQPSASDRFILIDVSDPDYSANFVDISKVDQVIDHHPGFERYWQDRIGDGAHIELIGAACTLVFEQWHAAGVVDKMSRTAARLLVTGILDNTLNFGAQITSDRDRDAYTKLLELAELPNSWPQQYFSECQEAVLADVSQSLTNDTKILNFASLPGKLSVGQIVLWDTKEVLENHRDDVDRVLSGTDINWFLNLVNVGDKKSIFICPDGPTQAWLSQLLDLHFVGDVAQADRLWLRKEISARDQSAS
ncbi:MAG: DHH family phosphoesterase [Candidatus Saccharimonadales bacterium]